MTLLEAIAHHEGFYVKGSRAGRNHNPGNIEWHPGPDGFAFLHGADGAEVIPHGYNETARFAYFPTDEIGFAAMKALLQTPGYAGKSVAQALNRWAPSVENNVSSYLADVCANAGCSPDDLIDPLVAES